MSYGIDWHYRGGRAAILNGLVVAVVPALGRVLVTFEASTLELIPSTNTMRRPGLEGAAR